MKLRSLTIRMTERMFNETKRMADECRIPHGEWIRRCMCWGTEDPNRVVRIMFPEEFKVGPRGRPLGQ
ncbi:MAG: hypothetical protein OXP66_02865 [Candidatus Tectomicrobia bacterium]|nr:hypothetical protein [Candidatus Tectomicrobia bacterium]